MKRQVTYPFCAVYGQEAMKNTLLWNTINPKIGGALLCGEKGTVKSTVVRALADLLSDTKAAELPLNTTEDRLM
jgi:Mg-chelatase subunit ChlI